MTAGCLGHIAVVLRAEGLGVGPTFSSVTDDAHPRRGNHATSMVELEQLIDALKADLSADEFVERGLSVQGTFDEIDDPVLIGPDGTPIMTWREGYPYDERMSRHDYEEHKRLLQIELLKLQAWLQKSGHKVCVLFEGRDAAGKGGTIKRFMEHLDPRLARVEAQPQRPRITRPLARLHRRQRKDVPTHRHDRSAMDRRTEQRQETRPGRSHAISARPVRLPDKDHAVVGVPDPLIVGPPGLVSADAGELMT